MRQLAKASVVAVVLMSACTDLFGPREWVVTMDVAPERVPCQGFIPQDCLRVRERPDTAWTFFYDSIEGFAFEAGFNYTIRVRVREIRNPPADGSSRAYRLLAVLTKEPA